MPLECRMKMPNCTARHLVVRDLRSGVRGVAQVDPCLAATDHRVVLHDAADANRTCARPYSPASNTALSVNRRSSRPEREHPHGRPADEHDPRHRHVGDTLRDLALGSRPCPSTHTPAPPDALRAWALGQLRRRLEHRAAPGRAGTSQRDAVLRDRDRLLVDARRRAGSCRPCVRDRSPPAPSRSDGPPTSSAPAPRRPGPPRAPPAATSTNADQDPDHTFHACTSSVDVTAALYAHDADGEPTRRGLRGGETGVAERPGRGRAALALLLARARHARVRRCAPRPHGARASRRRRRTSRPPRGRASPSRAARPRARRACRGSPSRMSSATSCASSISRRTSWSISNATASE